MRTHIDYGIYFNDDFCQIARMEFGIPVIKLSETMKESTPLCVHFNKRGDIFIGNTAFNVIKNDQIRALNSFEAGKTNSFIQFTRTLGTTHTYESSNTGKFYSSSNNHVFDILISGKTLLTLLFAGSTINVTIKIDKSQLMTVIAKFPEINYTEEIKLDIRQSHPNSRNDIEKLKSELVLFYSDNTGMGKERFRFLLGELIRIGKNELGQDEKMRIIDLVKKELIKWM